MSIYEETTGQLNLTEQHIYGSSRLGMRTLRTDMLTAPTPVHTGVKETIRGERRYELTNHLLRSSWDLRSEALEMRVPAYPGGNVLVVCSDQLTATDGDSNNLVDFYAAEVMSYSDYYPFGGPMTDRTSGESRYGFNGKERDDEYSGEGNTYDFGARIYDGRLGRWWSVDQLQAKLPWSSCYAYCENSPIEFFDPDGKKKRRYIVINNHVTNSTTKIQLPSSNELKSRAFEVRQEPFGIRSDCWHYEYEWYDYSQSLIFDVYDDRIELSVFEDLDDYPRTTTTFEWEWYAKMKVSELDKVWGGICWTTTGYVGPGNDKDKIGRVDTPYENIDDLMGVFDLAFRNRGIGNEFNIPESLKAESLLLKTLDAIQSKVSKQSEKLDVFTGLLLKLKDNLPTKELQYYHCTICKKVFDSNKNEVTEKEINTMGLSTDKIPQITPASDEHGD